MTNVVPELNNFEMVMAGKNLVIRSAKFTGQFFLQFTNFNIRIDGIIYISSIVIARMFLIIIRFVHK